MAEWISQYWIEVVFGLVCTGFGTMFAAYFRKLKSMRMEFNAIKLAMQAQLRNSIVQTYYEAKDRGYIQMYKMEVVNLMYTQYKNLGGNSFVSHLVEEILDMEKRET